VRALEKAGYRVLKSTDGLETLRVLKRSAPALVVLDIGMPGLDGKAVMRIVRSMGASAPIVVFLTALDGEDSRREGLELGAADYITKPFTPADLVARVGAALKS
jgi:DNA-binding response OmpR family regulator